MLSKRHMDDFILLIFSSVAWRTGSDLRWEPDYCIDRVDNNVCVERRVVGACVWEGVCIWKRKDGEKVSMWPRSEPLAPTHGPSPPTHTHIYPFVRRSTNPVYLDSRHSRSLPLPAPHPHTPPATSLSEQHHNLRRLRSESSPDLEFIILIFNVIHLWWRIRGNFPRWSTCLWRRNVYLRGGNLQPAHLLVLQLPTLAVPSGAAEMDCDYETKDPNKKQTKWID